MDPPRDQEEMPDDSVLTPEDLDFREEEEVAELDESRFVIGAEGRPDVDKSAMGKSPEEDHRRSTPDTEAPTKKTTQQGAAGTESQELRGSDVKRWIGANLRRTDSQYAYRLAAKTGENVSHQQLASDDIGMAFDGLLMWYAQQVGDGTAVEDTLGILLSESNVRVRYPVTGLLAYLEEHDLDPEDSIGDLLETVREHDGLVFP
ncbi:hypothetical protein HTSR_1366 [Halodesulfurarchaeum formicicum]|uniref:Uncharacterized protein n=1 Tax=Halodesulfurarchaeum formicicum TaxID=1873524 RepID=A0A1D8S5B5_9EURY|nr:hypothetical protein [Halodesulfurarchaeum formicicum]AOW80542.1 hypothetical protein HTSR_1366 [Halodesulfurarchaeum formicicum]APE95881.1 hypothetical protein HSR6_1438 [Halodesulfurarchaeum formicicum]